jgi:hypothetical protein
MNLPLLHRRLAGVAKVKIKEKTQFEHFVSSAGPIGNAMVLQIPVLGKPCYLISNFYSSPLLISPGMKPPEIRRYHQQLRLQCVR